MGRAQCQKDGAADGGPRQHAKIACRGAEPHRALKVLGPDDVVKQKLRRRIPQHPGDPMNDQQYPRVPHLQRIGQKQHAPAQRHAHEEHHPDLDDAAGVEPLREGARVDREKQKRQPVRYDGEATECCRMKLAEDHPIADDVLDVVGQHRQRGTDEIHAETGVPQGCERLLGGRGLTQLCSNSSSARVTAAGCSRLER